MATIKPGIDKTGNTWTIRVQIQRNGKQGDKKRVVDGITLSRALAIQAEMRLELERELTEGRQEPETFQAYYTTWKNYLISIGKARVTTMKVREAMAKTLLLPFFGLMRMDRITSKEITKWMEWLSSFVTDSGAPKYSEEYLKTGWRDLKAMFSDAIHLILLPKDPTAGMNFYCKGRESEEKQALTPEEVKAVLEAARHESPDIHCMMVMAVTTGARFSEVTSWTWQDIDGQMIAINKSQVGGSVGRTKNKRHRRTPIHPYAMPILMAHKERQQASKIANIHGLIFPSNTGGYRFPSVLSKPFARCLERAGITKKVTPHGMRRTANNLVRVSLGDVAARKMVGHVSESQTARYSVVADQEMIDGQRAAYSFLLEEQSQESEQLAEVVEIRKAHEK